MSLPHDSLKVKVKVEWVKKNTQAIKEQEGLPGELRSKKHYSHAAADQRMLLCSSLVRIRGLIDEETVFSFWGWRSAISTHAHSD